MEIASGSALYALLRAFLFVGAVNCSANTWWNLGNGGYELWRNPQLYVVGAQPLCAHVSGLSAGQNKMCQLYHDHMPSVSAGARMAIRECQRQFRHDRWNCSTVKDGSVFGPITDIPSRELAFTHAVSAAGVVHAVARACREGRLTSCSCSKRARPTGLNGEFQWGGCGDDSEYGYRFSQGFIDIREREKNHPRFSDGLARALLNLHNNEAGRRSVYAYSKINCKCHGVSGSCSLKTCWNQLPDFKETGDRLKDRYDAASHVKFNKQGTKLVGESVRFKSPGKEDLVFLEQSPTYCDVDNGTGSRGTVGRTCDRDSQGMDGCKLMCCGRGYNIQQTIISERCHCKFQWCCNVKCKTCQRQAEVFTCK